MSDAGRIPSEVRRLQIEVADPKVSAWVAANAGSGKTHVLVQRVINLLLMGVAPEKILCITFTKAAAANMARRVFDTLGAWTALDDAALDEALRDRGAVRPDAQLRAAARRLFARALETPGGLKVQTIHAFCTQLLHQFPFEANVAARFDVLDGTAQAQLLEQLTLDVLLAGADAPETALGRALAAAMTAAADVTFREVIRDAVARHDAIDEWFGKAGGDVDAAVGRLSEALGIDPSDSRKAVDEEFFAGVIIAPREWSALATALMKGSKSDAAQARRFRALATLSLEDRVETYLDIFCTAEGAPRKNIVTKSIEDASLVERLVAEQARVCALLERRRAVVCRDRSAALITVVDGVLRRYRSEKARRGLLDYDDLIDKTLNLLRNVDAAWVHYKLDQGIDHVLIDEAQDTSKKQWEIVRLLTAEFTAGAGARTVRRTIFPVGDEKQSIYSFQNAAPREFAEMRRFFEVAHRDGGLEFVFRKLEHSFRSGESVLAAVDEVFKDKIIAASVTSDRDGFPPHIALPGAPPGLVEIWEPFKPDERRDVEPWDAPFDLQQQTSPRVKLAQQIARTVRTLVDDGTAVGAGRRAARYGDILVLVRQRGPLFEAIIRALKNEAVEVAGADRLILTEHIAVMDLMALADALLLPQDDLALATVLRSPLFGFTDDDLFKIAWDRGSASLRAALSAKAGAQDNFTHAAQRLDELAAAAASQTPFAFYANLLGAGGARRRFLSRFGAEANDALDEFLNLALDYERREAPSLRGFLAWLREARAEVKRDLEIAREEVRVMTVHGAKGLEAPIVILADTMTKPAGPKPPRLLELKGGECRPLVWAARKEDDVPPVAAARQAARDEAEHEYRRLLYVAMTRAADRLIVCGADGEDKRPDRCWYDLVRDALAPLLLEEEEYGQKILRFRKETQRPQPPFIDRAPAVESPDMLGTRPESPPWLQENAQREALRAMPLSPSNAFSELGGSGAARKMPAAALQKALARGRLVHRLLQSLPDIPIERRIGAAARYLARAIDLTADERADLARAVFGILDDPRFTELFATGSRAEVPIVGRITPPQGAPIVVSGQVDRLAVTGNAVLIADFKTDRSVPDRLEEVKPYVTQLALYRAVLGRLYPARPIRAVLVFSAGPSLLEVPPAAMDAALDAALAKARSTPVTVG